MRYSILVGTVVLSFALNSQAQNRSTEKMDSGRSSISGGGLFVEPILSYSTEQASIKTSQLPVISDDTSGETRGVGVGSRLGFHISEILFFGADGRYARTRFDDSSYGSADGSSYNLGPVVGIQTPVAGLRVWTSYAMLGEFDPGPGHQGFDVKFNDPRGWRIGAGFHLLSVSLNLEYQDLTYATTEIQSFGSINGGGDSSVDFNNQGWTASLSFPVEL
ncbi:MAG: hypothetical protein COT73_05150 [Bdellovibrio sp. CG10_big_fil_rev_8_21_14_0_10_47_8]|nr:MAG: hypothetical protein COT73_05150 [Bdellovibrio sp. CG10_big_fil_rev_8_21_14_0_10_47_8]